MPSIFHAPGNSTPALRTLRNIPTRVAEMRAREELQAGIFDSVNTRLERAFRLREGTMRKSRWHMFHSSCEAFLWWPMLWGGRFVHLLDVAVFNLAHEVGAMEEIGLHLGGNLAWYHEELVVNHLAPDNWPPSGNQVRPPLEQERDVPENQARDD